MGLGEAAEAAIKANGEGVARIGAVSCGRDVVSQTFLWSTAALRLYDGAARCLWGADGRLVGRPVMRRGRQTARRRCARRARCCSRPEGRSSVLPLALSILFPGISSVLWLSILMLWLSSLLF
jgi:hypothetical protein